MSRWKTPEPLEIRVIAPDCICPEHRNGCPVQVGEHTLKLIEQYVPWRDGVPRWRWRAHCSCGHSRPHWTYQSDSAAYHAWLTHVRKYS